MMPEQHTVNPVRTTEHIGVLYSCAPHFNKALQTLREQYPEARITALIPPDFPSDAIHALVDEALPFAPVPQMRRSFSQTWRLLCIIRQRRFSIFVVLFNSAKLQALAGLSGAERCYCFGLDNTLHALQMRLFSTMTAIILRRIRGYLLYWRIWLCIRLTPIGVPLSATNPPNQSGSDRLLK